MLVYIIRRLLLVVPTLLGIMVVNFAIIQFAPGGPVEQTIARWQGAGGGGHQPVLRYRFGLAGRQQR